jgi:hypothetical protein
MNTNRRRAGRVRAGELFQLLLAMISCGIFAGNAAAQPRESLAGESAAQALEKSIGAETYDINCGPVRANVGARLGVNYTDNVFYSEDRKDDVMLNPEVTLDALYPVTQLNTLRLSLGVGYEWYLINHVLNANSPLVQPGSELAFNVFVGDFRIKLHESFSYQESLFINSPSGTQQFFNFTNVGTFARLDNNAGCDVTWDLNQTVLTAGYDHENFTSYTSSFDYLDRVSEWFTASAGYFLGDHLQTGVEGQASLHHYDQQTVLNNNWRGRTGPFVDATLLEGVTLRTGGGYDLARYDAAGSGNSDYDSYYAYGRLTQETRLFSHSLEGGHKNLLGDSANNLRTTYVRYAVASPIVRHLDLGANVAVDWAEEYGGPSGYDENFTYYEAGFTAGWQFHKQWRAELGYSYQSKTSDVAGAAYERDRVTVALVWKY